MENENPRVSPLWEHSLTTLLGHDPTSDLGIALRQWVHFQGVHNILDLLSWDQEELKVTPAQQVYSLDDHSQNLYLRTNQIKQILELITYMKHIFGSYSSGIAPQDDPFHPFTPDEWTQQAQHKCGRELYDRILTYGTLLDVLWWMYHTWITYGTVRRIA